MEVTRDSYSWNLLTKLMVFYRQIQFSRAIAATTEAILMRTSAEQVPSLHRIAPRYSKLVTFSNVGPFLLIPALKLFVLFVTILLLFALTSSPYAGTPATSLLVS